MGNIAVLILASQLLVHIFFVLPKLESEIKTLKQKCELISQQKDNNG